VARPERLGGGCGTPPGADAKGCPDPAGPQTTARWPGRAAALAASALPRGPAIDSVARQRPQCTSRLLRLLDECRAGAGCGRPLLVSSFFPERGARSRKPLLCAIQSKRGVICRRARQPPLTADRSPAQPSGARGAAPSATPPPRPNNSGCSKRDPSGAPRMPIAQPAPAARATARLRFQGPGVHTASIARAPAPGSVIWDGRRGALEQRGGP
jgi:hypothetical protein